MDVPHPLVFNRFRASLRIPDASRQEEHIEVTCWRDMLFGILTCASPAEAISALDLGTKNIARKL